MKRHISKTNENLELIFDLFKDIWFLCPYMLVEIFMPSLSLIPGSTNSTTVFFLGHLIDVCIVLRRLNQETINIQNHKIHVHASLQFYFAIKCRAYAVDEIRNTQKNKYTSPKKVDYIY